MPHRMRELQTLKDRYGFYLAKTPAPPSEPEYDGKRSGHSATWQGFRFTSGIRCPRSKAGWSRPKGQGAHESSPHVAQLRVRQRCEPRRATRNYWTGIRLDDFSPFVFYERVQSARSTDLNAFIGLEQLRKAGLDDRPTAKPITIAISSSWGRFYTQRPPQGSKVSNISFGLLADSPEQRNASSGRWCRGSRDTHLLKPAIWVCIRSG